MNNDIIDRTRAEKELRIALQAARAKNAQYEQALAMISDIVWGYDANTRGEYTGAYISPVADRMLGLPIGTIGDDFEKYHSYIHPDDLPAVQDTFFEVIRMRGKNKTVEYRMQKADGTLFWVRSKCSAYDRGTIFGTTRDITERKHAELALQESEERFRTIFENNSAAIAIIERDTTISMVNKEFGKLTLFEKEDVIGISWTSLISPEDLERMLEYNRKRYIDPKNAPEKYEFAYYRNDGKIRSALMSVAMIPTSQQIVCSFVDITERKLAEAELVKHRDNLEELVKERTAELKEKNSLLTGEITERKRVEEALRERVKELNCLYALADLIENEDNLEKIFQGTVELMPLGWSHPKSSCARITFEGRQYQTANFRETDRRLSADLSVNGRSAGVVELCYIEEQLIRDEGPFLKEEIDLINAIAEKLKMIVERKRVEEELRESVMRLKEAQRLGHLGSWDLNVVTGDLKWSDECYRIYGFRPQEFVPTYEKFRSIIHPEDLGFVQEQVDAALNNDKPYNVDFRFVLPNGEIGWIHCEGEVMRDAEGKPLCFIGTQIDITERKRTEEALLKSEARHRTILHTAMDGFWLTDTQGHLLEVNETYCRMSGYRAQELLAMRISDLEVGETADDVVAHRQMLMAQGEDRFESWHRRKDGSIYPVEVSVQHRSTEDCVFAGFLRDITERKRAEEALKKHSEHLERLVAERTKQLQEAARMATLGEMATMIGHDLRNPLQVIVSMVYLAKEMLTSADTPLLEGRLRITDILDEIEKSSVYMNRIVSDLQSYAGPMNLELAKADIHKLISDALYFLEIPESVEVSIEVENGLPEITIDPEKIKRVIVNLVNNSIQSMPKGGQLTIIAIRKGDSVVLTIRDKGVGISKEIIPKLFLPLFTTKAKGIGLGLAICKRLVEAHGGSIVVASKVNAGTEMTIEIPPQDEKTWKRNSY